MSIQELDLDNLKREPLDRKVLLLRALKNDLIGCYDMKEHYFNRGIIETLLPLLGTEVDEKLL